MPRRIPSENMDFFRSLLRSRNGQALVVEMENVLRLKYSRREIVAGDLIPPERTLCAWLNVSPASLRKTLHRLVAMGLLARLPRVGYAVSRPPFAKNDKTTWKIGLIYIDALGHGRLSPLNEVCHIERKVAEAGHVLAIAGTDGDTARENACIRRFREAGVNGLIVTPAFRGRESAELSAWIREGNPVVMIGHPGRWQLQKDLIEQCDIVDDDNEDGVRQVLRHLFDLGHDDIAMISNDEEQGSERMAAFRRFMRQQRPASAAGLIGGLPAGRAGGRKAFDLLWRKDDRPTAVVATADDLALGVIDAAREAGLNCPRDLSVCGFNNESMDGPNAIARLTTVDLCNERMADQVWGRLEARLKGVPLAPCREKTPARLVVRDSCGSPRRATGRVFPRRRGKTNKRMQP